VRHVIAFVTSLAFFSTCAALVAEASAEPSPAPSASPKIDPFCSVGFLTAGWDVHLDAHAKVVSDRLMARLYFDDSAPSARSLGAHLVLISDTQAYEADVPDLPLDNGKARRTVRFLIALPSAMPMKYVYVDGYDTDGGHFVDCPTEMSVTPTATYLQKQLTAEPSIAGATLPVVTAKLRQPLPSLPCGKIRIEGTVKRVVQPNWPYGITKRIESQIAVYLDSNGTVVETQVYRSSGSDEADEQARMAAFNSTYTPARFLCQPVVSEYLFTAIFQP
jgi:hypothetical protein